MDIAELTQLFDKFKFRENNFHNLMKYRISDVLLVSTFYDAFIFEQDGGLSEQILGEYCQLNLSTAPRVTSVPSAIQALTLLRERRFDLVITTVRMVDLTPFEFAQRAKEIQTDLPVLLVLSGESDKALVEANKVRMKVFDDVFMWSGDSKIFLAMIKSIEDKKNIDYDAEHGLVRVILLIEDSVEYYSIFLPMLYSEIMRQTQRLIQEEATEVYKRLRMRIRPKVLMAHDYQEAESLYRKYQNNLLCVITDVQYEKAGKLDDKAGLKFVESIREDKCSVPVLVQSLDRSAYSRAAELGAQFLDKASPHLLGQLHDFIIEQLGFGDFVFRRQGGYEEARARSLAEFVHMLRRVSEECVLYHARNNHFSAWLIAHGEVEAARRIKPMQVKDFPSTADMRKLLVDVFDDVKRSKHRGRIVEFANWSEPSREQVVRLADGSLGGKGRGLAFLNGLLYAMEYGKKYSGIDVSIPFTAIIGTDEYDRFLERNRFGRSLVTRSDEEIREAFLGGQLSEELVSRLKTLLEKFRGPLAVRSSGLLEDSQSRPFAGVYRTLMVANSDPQMFVRLSELTNAIKLVYSSVFESRAREYIESVDFAVEEEKMAVVLQEVAGLPHGAMYYPDISGVAQSFNFYPTGPMGQDDGVASVVLGLGRSVVEGERHFRFCPKYPRHDILAPRELIGQSQKSFYGIRLDGERFRALDIEDGAVVKADIKEAEAHGTLQLVGGVWDFTNDVLVEDFKRPGPRVVNFSSMLKYDMFPLAGILDDLLEVGRRAIGSTVEMEFAANVVERASPQSRPTFFLLQVRPLNVNHKDVDVDVDLQTERKDIAIYSEEGLGNGTIDDLTDVIFIRPEAFDPVLTPDIASEISAMNRKAREDSRSYVLVGPGRWGSKDRFLGVPVLWQDINKARVIVEVDLDNFRIEASQGTHFLHNVVGMNVAYVKVPWGGDNSWLDWDYLSSLEVVESGRFCVYCRAPGPLQIKMDGKRGRIVVYHAGRSCERADLPEDDVLAPSLE